MKGVYGSIIEDNPERGIEKIILINERISLQLAMSCLAELICNSFSSLKDGLVFVTIVADRPFSHSRPSSLRLSFFGFRSDEDTVTAKRAHQVIRVEGNIFSSKLYSIIQEIFVTMSDNVCIDINDDRVPNREIVSVSDG